MNDTLIRKIANGSDLIKHLDLIVCDSIDQYYDIIKQSVNDKEHEDKMIVLPEEYKGRDVMIDTIDVTNTYNETFHYDGRNQIDGFMTPDFKNMVVVNNDYDLRKTVCEKLYKVYPTDNFKFCNQSLTSIAVKLYE